MQRYDIYAQTIQSGAPVFLETESPIKSTGDDENKKINLIIQSSTGKRNAEYTFDTSGITFTTIPRQPYTTADQILQGPGNPGVKYVQRNVILTLTGNENWAWSASNPDSINVYYSSPTGKRSGIVPVCNFSKYGNTSNNPSNSVFYVYNQGEAGSYVGIAFRDATWANADAATPENLEVFKQKLRDLQAAGTPVKIIYNLKTPIETFLMPYRVNIHSYSPSFTATTTNSVKPTLRMTYAVR